MKKLEEKELQDLWDFIGKVPFGEIHRDIRE